MPHEIVTGRHLIVFKGNKMKKILFVNTICLLLSTFCQSKDSVAWSNPGRDHRDEGSFLGLYSVSNEGRLNQSNPLTSSLNCPFRASDTTILQFNSGSAATGAPDQITLHQCSGRNNNSSFGGLFSQSNRGANFLNPMSGSLSCPRGWDKQLVLTFNAQNASSGQPDQFSLFLCTGYGRDEVFGGLFATSNSHLTDSVNPFTRASSCPSGYNQVASIVFNAMNSRDGSPDQFTIFQCIRW